MKVSFYCSKRFYTASFLWLLLTTTAIAAAPVLNKPLAKRGTPGGEPHADLREVIIWGSECRLPTGQGLSFGGQHQRADDGRPHTRIFSEGKWTAIEEQLKRNNPLQSHHDSLWAIRTRLKDALGRARYLYFQGKTQAEEITLVKAKVNPALVEVEQSLADWVKDVQKSAQQMGAYEGGQIAFALEKIRSAVPAISPFAGRTEPDGLIALRKAQIELEIASEALDAEPPARVCSDVVYDAKTSLYVLFGGDHYDYLVNDTWVFDPARKKWFQRHPASAPEPRAHHQIEARGDGTVVVRGGYIYRNQASYGESTYCHVGPEPWVYDIGANRWSTTAPAAKPGATNTRTYRDAKYLPDFYLQGPRPDAAAHEAKLKSIPVNTWVEIKSPQRPQKLQLGRDWGTSVWDGDHDLILQWGGGHSAHGGTDVLHYHLATGRWEQPYPVEYCLGHVGSPSHFPCGFNFNRRPWIIMHAYKSYAYETKLKRLVITGRNVNWKYGHDFSFYLYDPISGDWGSRHPLHKDMRAVQYYLNSRVIHSPHGLLFWSSKREAFRLNTESLAWEKIKFQGELSRCGTDGGGLVYDPPRDRMLMVTKHWKPEGKGAFDGKIHALDLKSKMVTVLQPAGKEKVSRLFLREAAYNPEADIFLWAAQKGGRTIAYEPKENRWIAIKTGGELGFGFSTGHVYDAKRKLHWVAGGKGRVFCFRLDMAAAEIE